MLDEGIPFFETVFVEQQFDAFAGGQLAAAVLRVDAPALRRARPLSVFVPVVRRFLSSRIPGQGRSTTGITLPA